jgi:hypothetical protein
MAGTYKPHLLAYYGYYPFGTLAGGYRYGFKGK